MWNETVLTILLPYINELLSGIIVVVFTVIAFYAKKYIGVEIELKQKDLEAMNRSVLWETLTNAAINALADSSLKTEGQQVAKMVNYVQVGAKDSVKAFGLTESDITKRAEVALSEAVRKLPKWGYENGMAT